MGQQRDAPVPPLPDNPKWCENDDYELRGATSRRVLDVPHHIHLRDGRVQFEDGHVTGMIQAQDEQERSER